MAAFAAIAFAPALAIFARHGDRGFEGRKSFKEPKIEEKGFCSHLLSPRLPVPGRPVRLT
jgi:hypothetical protein